uniref:WSC domain-containing protein n=1 Tax=Branchiostoma floridae TaxID=7739 RepID=C3YRH1_BRAFL|eukprot:XP_002601156.1 hypothetical protein BRAFLDRAFT_75604 [Branchiostoma floridae]
MAAARICPFVDRESIVCDRLRFQTISVKSATYGQTCNCTSGEGNCGDCQTVNETRRVSNRCEGRRFCNVRPRDASEVFQGSPNCTGNVSTFLDVSYTCKNLPGYVGCFELGEAQTVYLLTFFENESSDSRMRMTVHDCLALCRKNQSLFAGLWNGTNCGCGIGLSANQSTVPTSQCDVNCTGEASQRCGGVNHVDIYRTIGHCGKISLNDGRGTVSPDHNGYFGIGETARIDCDTSGETWSLVVECLGTGQFNVTHPYCKEAPPGGGTLPIAIGAAVGGVVLLAAAIATVVIVMKRKRSPIPASSGTPPPDDVTADPSLEPTYDTIREEEEGGVTLALSGATCSYSTIGQPDVTSDPGSDGPVYSKPDKRKAKTTQNVEDLYAKPDKKGSGEVENVLYESAGEIGGASLGQGGGTDDVMYACPDDI